MARQKRTSWAVLLAAASLILLSSSGVAQQGTGTVEGRIVDENGRPQAEVWVTAVDMPDRAGLSWAGTLYTVRTDAEGRYRLLEVEAGRYVVIPGARSAAAVSKADMESVPVVSVRAGSRIIHDLTLPGSPGVVVSGRVRGHASYADLMWLHLGGNSLSQRAGVELDGSFVFRQVPSGIYSLTAGTPLFVWTSKEIRVEGQDLTDVEIVPDEVVGIQGRVVTEGGAPAPSFTLALEGSKGYARYSNILVMDSLRSSGMIGVVGSWPHEPHDVIFTARLPLGSYRVTIADLPAGYAVRSFKYGEVDLLQSPIQVAGEVQTLSITLSGPANLTSVKGRFVHDVELPPEIVSNHVSVHNSALLVPLEGAMRQDGSFEIPRVPPGVYALRSPSGLRLEVGPNGVRNLEFRNSRLQATYQAYVRAAARRSAILQTVPGASTAPKELRGRIEVEGRPAESTYLILRPLAGGPETSIHTDDGTFARPVPDGEYRVWIRRPTNGRQELRSMTYGTADLMKEPLRLNSEPRDTIQVWFDLQPETRVVSGLVTGATGNMENVHVILDGITRYQSAVKIDGSFEISKMPPGSYRMLTIGKEAPYSQPGIIKTLVVAETDLQRIEAPMPLAMQTVHGRIVVEKNYPIPLVSFTIRPHADRGAPFVVPYTVRSGQPGFGSIPVDHAGRFTMSVPQGRHRLRVDSSPYYSLKSMRYGSADLTKELLHIDPESAEELVITFSAPSQSWPRVRARMTALPAVNGLRAVLTSSRTRLPIETEPRRDGSFEFPRVPPDTYTVTTIPRMAGMVGQTISIGDRDVSMNLIVPTQQEYTLQVIERGGRRVEGLSSLSFQVEYGSQEAYIVQPRFTLRTAFEWMCIVDTCVPDRQVTVGQPMLAPSDFDASRFTLKLPSGRARLTVLAVPNGFVVESLTQGTLDLLQNQLVAAPGAPQDDIILTLR